MRKVPTLLSVLLVAAALVARSDGTSLAKLPPDQPLSRIAFGACHKLDRPLTVWDVILAQKPQVFIFLGDTIYKDTVDMNEKQAEFAKLGAVPGFARFRQSVPVVATWDDHDYGENDGGADYPKREESREIFLDFFGEPKDSPRRKHPGVYTSYVVGPEGKRTQIILLDTRYFRTQLNRDAGGGYHPQRDKDATMLGDEQWRWFAEQLRVPAEVRLIVSSIQVEHEDQPNEKWLNMPAERDKLFKTIADGKATGVIFISGDRHHGEISSMDIGAGYRVADITSSGLNCSYEPNDEPNRHREGRILWADNFGGVRIDWAAADPTIDLEVHASDDGSVAVRKRMKLSELQPAKGR